MSLPTTVEMTQVLMYLTTDTKIGTPRHDIPKICASAAAGFTML